MRRLSVKGSLSVYTADTCVYILFTTRGQQPLSYTVKILSRPSQSTLTSLSQSGHGTYMRSSPLIGWLLVTHWMTADDVCFCLFWTISLQNVFWMSWCHDDVTPGGGAFRGRGGWVVHVFAFLILVIFNIFIFSTLVSLKGLYRVQGLTWLFREGGVMRVQGGRG